jgi:uncharacterized membrane protein
MKDILTIIGIVIVVAVIFVGGIFLSWKTRPVRMAQFNNLEHRVEILEQRAGVAN